MLSAGKTALFQLVDQTDRAVMFHLEPLAQVADGKARGTGKPLQSEKRFVLFGGQPRFRREGAFTEAKKLSHRVTEIGEGFVILWQQSGHRHVGRITGT